MARKSSVEKNKRVQRMIDAKAETRKALKAMIKDQSISFEDRFKAIKKLSEMPRNSSAIRYRNRCNVTGRPRGYYRKFGVSRIALRELGSLGIIPGIRKASW